MLIIKKNTDADVIADLNFVYYPFRNSCIDIIYCSYVLEHLDNTIEIIEELHRICKPNAKIYISVPHFSSHNFYTDITHKRPFGIRSFNYFSDEQNIFEFPNFYSDVQFNIKIKRIQMNRIIFRFRNKLYKIDNKLLNFLVNISPWTQEYYERFFCFIFTAEGVSFELEVLK